MAKTGIQQYIEFLETVESERDEILIHVRDALEPTALAALQRIPGSPKRPRDWQTERQRRAYFASNGFGAGIPFVRTGKIAAQWEMIVSDGMLVIMNKSKVAKFIYGSLAQNRAAALRFQQRAHLATGWPVATDIVREFFDAAGELFNLRYQERVGDISETRRRAFTSASRKR